MGRPPAGSAGLTDELQAWARTWAERSCLDQDLALKITEAGALLRVARLLGANTNGRAAGRPSQGPGAGQDDPDGRSDG
jgi:hypothetical protein